MYILSKYFKHPQQRASTFASIHYRRVQDSRPKIAALPKPWWIPDTVHQLLYVSQHRKLT
ncbi:hypothetical protein C1H46_038558 [Malus baccata]|uniref:Uncharacterized protein n=1 Tax=Malus baccata TaxID=106549 RepID=A0A540KP20_MALBA|nr:hypothetical protein C1H46_038558 [Malus baccata]